ncbi:MAG: alpha/beta hydrolase [Bacteroidales bacterium]|jgi:pimeloyl-ACP methyl ester carboxylesterase|nr:alpha/beta hydrolase [Bacteroidales bacterium]MDD4215374.1 alpha/beta hydrolase [Bacteroidales bacterium]
MEDYCFYKNFKIHYTVKGQGNTVVLLHGFTESLNIWDDFSERLSISNKIVCIDLPGHGKSECIAPVHTMELMADCVKKVLDTLQVNKCFMIGHSMGGYVSLAYAGSWGHMLKGLGLFHSHAFADSPETIKNRMRTNNYIKSNHFNFLCEFISSLVAPENQKKYSEEIKKLIETSKQMSAEAVIAANSGMAERNDCTHILKGAAFPVLFIAGKKDTRVPFEKVLEQIAMPENCTALLLGGVAHMGYFEAKEETFDAIKTFVERSI